MTRNFSEILNLLSEALVEKPIDEQISGLNSQLANMAGKFEQLSSNMGKKTVRPMTPKSEFKINTSMQTEVCELIDREQFKEQMDTNCELQLSLHSAVDKIKKLKKFESYYKK